MGFSELTHWKRPWCWERLKVGREGDNRGWNGWMASLTQWRWVSVSSRSWWCTGKPGVLQSMGSQRVRHDWATKLTDWFHLDGIHSSMWLFSWTVWCQICLCKYSVLFTGHLNYPTPSFPITTTLQPILNSFLMPFTLIFSPLNLALSAFSTYVLLNVRNVLLIS